MKPSLLRQILLYRYRYIVAFVVFLSTLVIMLTSYPSLAPSGVSEAEMTTAVRSATLDWRTLGSVSLVDLPYAVLQKISLHLLGVNDLAIALPSMIMGIITGIMVVLMLGQWFRLNIALITGLILATSAPFLGLGRTGTSGIMVMFWLSLILLAATNIIHKTRYSRWWRILLLVTLPLSLYTPLMIYPLLALGIAGLLHPHVRFLLSRISPKQYAIVTGVVLVLLTPLIWTGVGHPERVRELFGFPEALPSFAALQSNLLFLAKSLFNVSKAIVGDVPQPLFGAASLLLILLGLIKTVADWHAARSYMLLIWLVLIIPIIIISPGYVTIVLMPATLLMAIGIETLIREWYRLFPLNPYARLAGLLPLIVLMGGIMISNTAQYFYGNYYGTPRTTYYHELTATHEQLQTHKDKVAHLAVAPQQKAFYDLLRRDYPKLTVDTSVNMLSKDFTIVHANANNAQATVRVPSRIVTSYQKGNAVLLRTY